MAEVKSGYVNGSDLLITVGGNAIGHCTSHRCTINSETKDRAVKPLMSAGSANGLYKNKTVTGISISISADGLIFAGETEASYDTLLTAMKTGKPVEVTCTERGGEAYLTGNFVITSLEQEAPAGDDASYSISLENDGAPTGWDATAVVSA